MHDFSKSVGDSDLAHGLLESAPDAMVIVDRDGRIVLVNRRAERLFGYSRAELLGQPMEVLLPERSRSRHCQLQARYFGDPQERPMGEGLEVFGRHKDGGELAVEINLSLFETDAGLLVSSAIRDVSERRKRKEEHVRRRAESKRAEAERSERQRELFRLLFENSPEPVTVSRLADGKYLAVNEAFLRLTQYTYEETIGRTSAELGIWTDVGDLRAIARAMRTAGVLRNHKANFCCKDGSIRTAFFSAVCTEVSGETCVLAFGHDITERRRSEEEIHRLNDELSFRLKELQTLLDVVPTGIAIAEDPECKRIVGNRRLAQILSLPAEKNFSLSAAPEERPALKAYRDGRELAPEDLPVQRAAAEGISVEDVELDVLGPDGKVRKLQGSAVPLFDSHGKVRGSVGSFVDITKRRRAERYLALQYAVTGVLATANSLAEATPNLIQCICAGLEWELGELWEVDPEANVLGWSQMWHVPSLDARAIEAISRGAKVFRGEGLAGSVWANGQSRWIVDLAAERGIRRHPTLVEMGLRGAVAFPVRRGEEINAVMVFFSRSSSEPDADLLRILVALGRQIGGFIERKEAENAVWESEARYRALFEGSKDIVMLTTMEGKVLEANPAAVKSFGYSSKEDFLRAQVDRDLYLDPNDRTSFLRKIDQEGYVQDYDLKVKRTDGQVMNLLVTAISTRDSRTGRVQFWAIGRDITERKRQEQALREISGRILQVQEEERRRIARELHDTTVQSLAALGMYFSLVKQSAPSLDPKIRRVLSEGLDLAEQCAREIRTISYLLHPPLLEELGLASVLRSYVEGFEQRSGISVDLRVSSKLGRLPRDVELTFFRVTQEGLANVHRHSKSKTAVIDVARDRARVTLEIKDEGRGIAPGVLARVVGGSASLGVGIAGMRERLRQLQGQLEINSGANGTTVRAVIPLASSSDDS